MNHARDTAHLTTEELAGRTSENLGYPPNILRYQSNLAASPEDPTPPGGARGRLPVILGSDVRIPPLYLFRLPPHVLPRDGRSAGDLLPVVIGVLSHAPASYPPSHLSHQGREEAVSGPVSSSRSSSAL